MGHIFLPPGTEAPPLPARWWRGTPRQLFSVPVVIHPPTALATGTPVAPRASSLWAPNTPGGPTAPEDIFDEACIP